MKNQDIFHAMTIKLEACDIPKQIRKWIPVFEELLKEW